MVSLRLCRYRKALHLEPAVVRLTGQDVSWRFCMSWQTFLSFQNRILPQRECCELRCVESRDDKAKALD